MIEFEKASRYIKMLHELYNVRSLIIDEMGEDANETFLVNELIKNIHLHLNAIEIYKPISDFELALQNRSNEDSRPTEDSDSGFADAAFNQGLQFDLSDHKTASSEFEETKEPTEAEDKEDESSFRSAIENRSKSNEEVEEEVESEVDVDDEDSYDWDVEEEEEDSDQDDNENDFGDEIEVEEEPDSEEDHETDEDEEEVEDEVEEEPEVEEIQEEAPKPKLKGIRILSRKPQPEPEPESSAPDPEEEEEEISEPEPEPEPFYEPEPEPYSEPEPEVEPEPEPQPQRNLFSFDDVSTETTEPEKQQSNSDTRFNADYDDLFDQGNANEISDRLSSAVVSDLRKAFGLNERIYYTNELFNKNKPAFESALDVLNGLDDFEYAREYIEKKLIDDFNWSEPRRRSKAKTFIRTVRRKFD